MSDSQSQPSADPNGESPDSGGSQNNSTADAQAGSSSSSSSSSNSPTATQACTSCKKSPTHEKPPRPCTKCHSVQYCSKECQKADFKKHKRACAKEAQIYAQTADIKLAAPSRAPRDGFRGGLQKWQFDT